MEALRTFFQANAATALPAAGAVIGLLFGYVAARSSFCVMGAVSDWRAAESYGRLGALSLAMAISIAGAQTLNALEIADLERSMYLSTRLNWVGALCGGFVFGVGMVFAGGCASRNLVRAGAGDLRALIVLLVLSLSALATLSGIIGPIRSRLEAQTAISSTDLGLASAGLPQVLQAFGLQPLPASLAATLALGVPLLTFAFGRASLLTDFRNLLGGLGAGALVIFGWFVTGLAFDEMASRPALPTSLSFVKPVADTVDWLERASALGLPGFGTATVLGVVLGSALATLRAGHWRLVGFADTSDLVRHILGALAMGFGGVLALGCSIGQGLTGLSTLALQSIMAFSAILAGTYWGLGALERRL